MFSAKIKFLPQKFSGRIAALFVILFILSSVMVSAIAYALFSGYLVKNDRGLVEAKWNEYAAVLAAGGIPALSQKLAEKDPDTARLLVELQDPNGNPLFLRLPADLSHFGVDHVNANLQALGQQPGWGFIEAAADEDQLELLGRPTEDGKFLRVGRSTDDREDLLEHFAKVSLIAIALAAVIGTFISRFVANRALLPLRSLLSTIGQVRQGALAARVPVSGTRDEMEELGVIFNQMLDRVEKLVTGMRETVDNVAHDVRTPLTRIRAVAELRLQAPAASSEDRAALEECAESANETITLLNSVLDLAEAEAGTTKRKRETVAMRSLVEPVLDVYALVAEEKAIRLEFSPERNPSVCVDPAQIKQVISNLVDNAIKYSPRGTVVRVDIQEVPGWVRLTVTDQGPGIDPGDLPRIWERLFRGDKSRSARGLGIGLSLVKAIAEVHAGTVSVETELGRGSAFTLSLPVA